MLVPRLTLEIRSSFVVGRVTSRQKKRGGPEESGHLYMPISPRQIKWKVTAMRAISASASLDLPARDNSAPFRPRKKLEDERRSSYQRPL
jgi:hypothetical protein